VCICSKKLTGNQLSVASRRFKSFTRVFHAHVATNSERNETLYKHKLQTIDNGEFDVLCYSDDANHEKYKDDGNRCDQNNCCCSRQTCMRLQVNKALTVLSIYFFLFLEEQVSVQICHNVSAKCYSF